MKKIEKLDYIAMYIPKQAKLSSETLESLIVVNVNRLTLKINQIIDVINKEKI